MNVDDGRRAILDGSPDLILAIDRGGHLTYVNRAAAARWPAAVLGRPADLLFPEDARGALSDAIAEVRAGGASQRFEWGERGHGGIRAWFVAKVYADCDDCLCSSTDVTQLKRTEERLRRSERLMVDTQGAAHFGTWEWDVRELNATWSDELYRIYGLSPETYTPSYEAYLTKIHPEDRQRVIDATNRVFHEHIPYSHDERIFRPDGSIRHLHTWAHPVLDETGKLTTLVGVCQDITDQKLVEEQIQTRVVERTRTIETSMRDLEAFNTMASHDLRAPITVIQMSTDLLLRETEAIPRRATEIIGRIQRAVALMTSLVDDLLTLARVGYATIERSDVDLSALAESVVAELRRAHPERVVTVTIQPHLRCTADRDMLRSVMTHLIGNAWKYSSRVAHATIEIGSTIAGDRSEVFVRDNGAGFDMKDAYRLFLPFERLHRGDDFIGTGVGLTIVQRIIERHGGHVRGESKAGEGALFVFDLL